MSSAKERLKSYEEMRDRKRSGEPGDADATFDWADHRPIFVIQKHDVSNLHYDFRIEVDGVLKSWAVPKGPSTDPRVKRLMLPTEDHPPAYADFEGVIPQGEYGGDTVLIWDGGGYHNLKEEDTDGDENAKSVAQQLEDGEATIWLEGEKVFSGYALIRTDSGDHERWLLIKMDDDEADARRNPTSTEPESVATGRTLDEIRDDAMREPADTESE